MGRTVGASTSGDGMWSRKSYAECAPLGARAMGGPDGSALAIGWSCDVQIKTVSTDMDAKIDATHCITPNLKGWDMVKEIKGSRGSSCSTSFGLSTRGWGRYSTSRASLRASGLRVTRHGAH